MDHARCCEGRGAERQCRCHLRGLRNLQCDAHRHRCHRTFRLHNPAGLRGRGGTRSRLRHRPSRGAERRICPLHRPLEVCPQQVAVAAERHSWSRHHQWSEHSLQSRKVRCLQPYACGIERCRHQPCYPRTSPCGGQRRLAQRSFILAAGCYGEDCRKSPPRRPA